MAWMEGARDDRDDRYGAGATTRPIEAPSVLKSLLSKGIHHPFVRNVATVATGTAASQALAFAFTPLITRIYGPEAYGLLGIFMSIAGPLTVLAALGYPYAIVLPRSEADARGLVRLSIWISLVAMLLATLGIHVFGDSVLRALNAEAIAGFVYLIPLASFVAVLGQVMGQWLIRKEAFGFSARYGVLTTLIHNTLKVGIGFFSPTAIALIAADTFGKLTGTALTLLGLLKRRTRSSGPRSEETGMGASALARRFGDFPLLRTPQNLINVFSLSLPMLLLAAYFGAGDAGQYAIAMSVLGVPVALIGGSVGSVFYPRVTATISEGGDARRLIARATAGIALVGALPFLTLVLAAPPIFELVFGEEWRTAGIYAQWLAVWRFLGFANRPSVAAIPALRVQGVLLAHEVVSVTLRVAALYLGFRVLGDAVSAIALFSIVGAVLNLWLILYVIRVSARTPGVQ